MPCERPSVGCRPGRHSHCRTAPLHFLFPSLTAQERSLSLFSFPCLFVPLFSSLLSLLLLSVPRLGCVSFRPEPLLVLLRLPPSAQPDDYAVLVLRLIIAVGILLCEAGPHERLHLLCRLACGLPAGKMPG